MLCWWEESEECCSVCQDPWTDYGRCSFGLGDPVDKQDLPCL